jgi:DNA-binding NarL/FixJ family response regulator
MLTVSDEADDLFAALNAGASGYLLKDIDPRDLVTAVHAAAGGEAPLAGTMTARLIEEFRRRGRRTTLATPDGRGVELTPREWDVLEGLAEGSSTGEMAARLGIEPVTVRRHIAALLGRLGVATRDEAADALRRNRLPRRSSD